MIDEPEKAGFGRLDFIGAAASRSRRRSDLG